MYTEDQLYGMLDTSMEQQLSFRVKGDFLGIYELKPKEVYDKLTDDYLDEKILGYVDLIVKADLEGNKLGIRGEVLKLGFEERYYGLRYAIEKIGDSIEDLMYELIKKVLGLMPREVILLSKQVSTVEGYQDFYERIYQKLITSKSYESDKDILYIINNQVEEESMYGEFIEVMVGVVDRLHLYHDFIFEELYYTPSTLRRAIRLDIEEDINGLIMKDFPIKEYLEEDVGVYGVTYREDDLYLGYMEEVMPLKPTKVLERLWVDIEMWLEEEELLSDEGREYYLEQFSYGKYLYNGEQLLSFRDGLTILSKLGDFRKIASSKVLKGELKIIQQEFIGGKLDE